MNSIQIFSIAVESDATHIYGDHRLIDPAVFSRTFAQDRSLTNEFLKPFYRGERKNLVQHFTSATVDVEDQEASFDLLARMSDGSVYGVVIVPPYFQINTAYTLLSCVALSQFAGFGTRRQSDKPTTLIYLSEVGFPGWEGPDVPVKRLHYETEFDMPLTILGIDLPRVERGHPYYEIAQDLLSQEPLKMYHKEFGEKILSLLRDYPFPCA